jgi:hypothetical protein
MAELPAFAIVFASLGVFWLLMCEGAATAYVRPVQVVAVSVSAVMGAPGLSLRGEVRAPFPIYGAGLAAMSAVVVGLFDAPYDWDGKKCTAPTGELAKAVE